MRTPIYIALVASSVTALTLGTCYRAMAAEPSTSHSIVLTSEDINALIAALDLATKTGGLQAAQTTLPLALKLQEAQREPGAK